MSVSILQEAVVFLTYVEHGKTFPLNERLLFWFISPKKCIAHVFHLKICFLSSISFIYFYAFLLCYFVWLISSVMILLKSGYKQEKSQNYFWIPSPNLGNYS